MMSGLIFSTVAALCLSVMLSANAATVADAAMAGDKTAVRALLKQGMDVNAAQGDGMTALHWAARTGDVELAQMLIYAGANVKAMTRLGGYTPLIMAAQVGNAEMIGLLLKSDADAKVATSNGTTPLMLAASAGQADAVRVLLERGADPDAKENARGETALMFAANFNRVEAMKALLEKGANFNAATRVVDLASLTQAGFGGGGQGPPPGQGPQAAPGGPATPAGAPGAGRGPAAPPAGEPQAPPAASAAAGAPPTAAPQERPGAPAAAQAGAQAGGQGGGGGRGGGAAPPRGPDIAGVTRQFRFNELVSTQGGLTPLLFAARQGHIEAAKTLLDAGADINQHSKGDNTTPLLMAVINGHFDLAKVLVERGADVRAASDNGVTPLYAVLNVQWAPKALYPQPRAYAQQQLSHLEMMKILIDKGADVNARLKMKVWYSGYNSTLPASTRLAPRRSGARRMPAMSRR